MKLFISWSGELSGQVANKLHEWIPTVIQSVEVFFSPEDIEKGENWNQRLIKELADCDYGIVCLTSQNVQAPWINFESGALAKSLDSRVSTLMIGISPSDIKGPLSRLQNTKFEKEDILKLLKSINKQIEKPLTDKVLESTFGIMWDSLNEDIEPLILASESRNVGKRTNAANKSISEPIEEVLRIVRNIDTRISKMPRKSSNDIHPNQLSLDFTPSYLQENSIDPPQYGVLLLGYDRANKESFLRVLGDATGIGQRNAERFLDDPLPMLIADNLPPQIALRLSFALEEEGVVVKILPTELISSHDKARLRRINILQPPMWKKLNHPTIINEDSDLPF